jgi:branched-chain amino acid transport system permease protein
MPRNNLSKPIGLAVLAIIVVALPFALREYYVDVVTMLLINVIVVVSFRLITTIGGWSLAHIPLMGAGAYATALMTGAFGWPFWLTLPLAGLAAGLVGLAMSYPLVRTKGFAFFIASFAAGDAMRLCWMRFRVPFGGHRGLTNIPAPEAIPIPGLRTIDFSEAIPYYFLALVVTTLCLVVLYRLDKSRIGDTLKAINSQDSLAKSVGINITQYKILAFAIGSFFAGIAGVLLAHRLWAVEPQQFGFTTTLYLLVWVVFGGTGTFAGPIIGVTVLTVLSELLDPLAEWVPMIYGAILISTLLFLPEGLEGLPRRLAWLGRVRISFEVRSREVKQPVSPAGELREASS